MIDVLINSMKLAIQKLEKWPSRKVHIFHHNDTDGLTSGAILTKAFERNGYEIELVCLEKPYPAVLKKIFQNEGKILIFADFAGRIAPVLSEMNGGKNLVLILDHHVAEESKEPNVMNLDPDLFGLKGDRDISASTTCYIFAKIMDVKNSDLAYLAALGAAGDEFFVDGRLVSENRKVLIEALNQGLVNIYEREVGEQYLFKTNRGEITGEVFTEYLDTLGGAGFYKDGPAAGVKVCLEGFTRESEDMVQSLKIIKDKAFKDELNRLKSGGFNHTSHIQWFHVENRFSPMGVKMIGAFCDAIKNMDFVYPDKYIAGFQVIPREVPGFGKVNLNEAKISMRVSACLEKEIRNGRAMGLNILLPDATHRLGGFSDACHSLTAATTVAPGKEEMLIEEMEKILVP